VRTVKNKKMASPRSRPGAPTISDVARAAGVSTMTVSRVMNRAGNVRRETLVAVDAAIERLSYAPNPAARSLAGAQQMRIAILYGSPASAWLSELLLGAMELAGRSHVQLVVEKCDSGGEGLASVRKLVEGGVEGVILPPPLGDCEQLIQLLCKSATPSVVVASGAPPQTVSAVGIDDRAAAHALTTHLLDLGHMRIGFIAGSPELGASARRQHGYEQALQAWGVKPAPELIEPGLFTYRSGLDAAERLLRLPIPPSAIFASNDDMAAATVAVAHSLGLAVPSDLTVCGFDDTVMATAIWPELTTVRQPVGLMSRMALEMLMSAVKARRGGKAVPVKHECVDFTLVRRHSDAAPRRRPPARQLRQA
jgi:LacI family transcriptional regulator